SNLDIKYLGPIDGHDEAAVEQALRQAKHYELPVLVHVITQKGRGYAPARNDEADRFHAVGVIDPETGLAVAASSKVDWAAAFGGLHPVFAVYATFLGRALDQVLMDVALHHAGVTFVLHRAGVTGPDGASHHGMWDLAMLQIVPGIRIASPRDGATLAEELAEAVAVDDAPTVLRLPKGAVPADLPAIERLDDGVDVLARGDGAD